MGTAQEWRVSDIERLPFRAVIDGKVRDISAFHGARFIECPCNEPVDEKSFILDLARIFSLSAV